MKVSCSEILKKNEENFRNISNNFYELKILDEFDLSRFSKRRKKDIPKKYKSFTDESSFQKNKNEVKKKCKRSGEEKLNSSFKNEKISSLVSTKTNVSYEKKQLSSSIISNHDLLEEVQKNINLRPKRKTEEDRLFDSNFFKTELPDLPHIDFNRSKNFTFSLAEKFTKNIKCKEMRKKYPDEVLAMYTLLREKILSYNDFY